MITERQLLCIMAAIVHADPSRMIHQEIGRDAACSVAIAADLYRKCRAECKQWRKEWDAAEREVIASEKAKQPHPFTGILEGIADRPCTTCGKPDRDPIHFREINPVHAFQTPSYSAGPPALCARPGCGKPAMDAVHGYTGI